MAHLKESSGWIGERLVVAAVVATALAAVVMLSGCASQTTDPASAESKPTELSVSAAATLKKPLDELAPEFEAANNVKIVYNFAAAGVLQKQIEGGAPCDVFASASPVQVNALIDQGLISVESTVTFASNELVIIVPTGNPKGIGTPADLSKATKIVTGNPETAVHGTKSKELLTGLGLWESLQGRFVFAETAGQTVDYVGRGEVDAGLVFASEVKGNTAVEVAYVVPATAIKPVRYVAAPIKDSSHAELAEKFVAYLVTPEAQEVLTANGFKPAPSK